MLPRYHLVVDGEGCQFPLLNEALALYSFLKSMSHRFEYMQIEEPLIVQRRGQFPGITGVIVSDTFEISVHTFPLQKEVSVEIRSYKKFNIYKIRDYIIKYFNLNLSKVVVNNLDDRTKEVVECQEPGCIRRAVKEWHGRRVCKDHYDYYKDEDYKLHQVDL